MTLLHRAIIRHHMMCYFCRIKKKLTNFLPKFVNLTWRYRPDLLHFHSPPGNGNRGVAAVETGGKQMSTGHLHLNLQICPSLFLQKENAHLLVCVSFWRYRPDLNWRITVLQTGALPLGYGTIWKSGTRGYVPDLWSGRRGSNSLPPPWQGGALPDELHPHFGASGRN